MAENDGQEKTEQPTGKRIEDARKKGQVPRSREMGTLCVLFSGVIGLLLVSPLFKSAFDKLFKLSWMRPREALFDPSDMMRSFFEAIAIVSVPIVAYGFFVILCALIGNLAVGGWNFSTQAMMPKFSKLNPMNGVKRMFGLQSWIELIKSILKVLFIGGIAYMLISGQVDHIVSLQTRNIPDCISEAMWLCFKVAVGIVSALIPIAAMDSWFQKWNTNRQLMMTRQEVKDEYKDTEGKPEVKGRIRRLQMEMANRRMIQEVPKADVVVTNPTHYAVALKYDQTKAHAAPEVLAKGVDEVALKIREVAKENKIEIIESPELARAIYYSTDLKKQIPEGLFAAVAQVLAYVFQLKMYKARRALAPKPLSKNLPIPDELKHD